jgi:segregation and condensation protein A
MNYRVEQEIFEGPLDLLLYLIKKEDLDICNVSISRITDGYLEYIHLMRVLDLEVVGEFLVVAATLMQIKSRALLPDEEAAEEEEDDSAEALIQQLAEYRKYKEAAGDLEQRELRQQNVFGRPPGREELDSEGEILLDVGLFDLLGALSSVLERLKEDPVTEIVQDETTVGEKIQFILGLLLKEEKINFTSTFAAARSKVEVIVTFLALLELIKIQKVKVKQAGQFGEIYLYRLQTADRKEKQTTEV